MILPVFIFLFVVCIALIVLGEQSEFLLLIVGMAMLAVLGTVMLFGGLEVQTGQTVAWEYTYLSGSNTTVTDIAQTVVDDYEPFAGTNAHIFGFCLTLGAMVGFGAIFFDMKRFVREFGK